VSDHHWKRPDMSSSGFCLLNTAGVAAVSADHVIIFCVTVMIRCLC
jgi:acetoin utilization deacetylase AcuC-like enzyme